MCSFGCQRNNLGLQWTLVGLHQTWVSGIITMTKNYGFSSFPYNMPHFINLFIPWFRLMDHLQIFHLKFAYLEIKHYIQHIISNIHLWIALTPFPQGGNWKTKLLRLVKQFLVILTSNNQTAMWWHCTNTRKLLLSEGTLPAQHQQPQTLLSQLGCTCERYPFLHLLFTIGLGSRLKLQNFSHICISQSSTISIRLCSKFDREIRINLHDQCTAYQWNR